MRGVLSVDWYRDPVRRADVEADLAGPARGPTRLLR
jgi:hypothetical protein